MLSNKFEMPLDLTIKPSRLLKIYFIILSLLAALAVFLASIPVAIKSILIIALLFLVKHLMKQVQPVITRLHLSSQNQWKIEVDGQSYPAQLNGECIVTAWFVWLNFRCVNRFGRVRIFRILVLPDNIDKNGFRQLKARLRIANPRQKKL